MKLNLRHAMWAVALAFTVAVLSAPKFAAAYQSEQGLEHSRGHDKNKNNANQDNPNYQRGWQHGQEDRINKHARAYRVHPDNDADRRAYEAGYDQGYTGRYGQNSQYGRPYRIGPGHRPFGDNIQNGAYNNGFQEGLGYGQADRNNGHSNRPTYSSTYQKGTNGYNSSYGSQTAYKNAFREGYKAGYAQGYNEGYRR
ncbi:MAG: hypothetical protein LAN64_13805 [Acidobacteriia bacterium]|nr:hypothetical protein [Terriglobia bacterium]